MKKIIFGITSLGVGGAERVLVDIVNNLSKNYEITIFCIYSGGAFEKEINKSVKIVSMYDKRYEEMSKFKRKIIPLYVLTCGKHIYKKYIKGKADTEVAFLEGPITRIFKNKSEAKKIVWVHNDIKEAFGRNLKAKLKNKIDEKIYSKYDKIIFVSKDNQKSFNELYKNKYFSKQEVIYNYIDKHRILKKADKNIELIPESQILTVARLVPQKAIDRLAKVHKKLIDAGFIHSINVIGDGPERENIEKLIKELNIGETFHLLGQIENPYPYIKKAKVFALLSNFEGYGMVIEEAKILDKPVVITATAAQEAVTGYGKKMILANTEEAIFEGLKQILSGNIVFEQNSTEYNNENILEEIKEIIE